MSGAVVVGAAPLAGHAARSFYTRLLSGAAAVVAADAAGEWAVSLGRVPDLVVGDFDSAATGARARLVALGVAVVEYPTDKDATDLQLAVDAALGRFGPPIVITAAFSARLDHTLAALGVLLHSGVGATAEEPGWTASLVRPGFPAVVECEPGALVSLVSPGGAHGVTTSGVRWPLADAALGPLSGLGISNVALGGRFTASCEIGQIVVFLGRTG